MDSKYFEILVTSVGSALAAGATVWWFLVRRELEPSGELAIDVNFAGRQDSQILVEVIATLSNKSSVRQSYKNFRVNLRYLRQTDSVTDGSSKIGHQLDFPNTIDTRVDSKRFFAYAVYINPRLTYRHSYITFVPDDASFIWVHCGMLFRTRDKWYSLKTTEHVKNGQRLFRVPDELPSVPIRDATSAARNAA